MTMFQPVIAVHAGAGYHSEEKEKSYKRACIVACNKAMKLLKDGLSAAVAVTEAVRCLEDSPTTNAGIGSSLTLSGDVECDAAVMDGESLLTGSVGALSDIQNPVCVALKLIEQQKLGNLPLGRLAPSFLVAAGATDWAVNHGFNRIARDKIISDSSKKFYEKHKKKLVAYENRIRKRKLKQQNQDEDEMTKRQKDGNCRINSVSSKTSDADTSGNCITQSVGDTVGAVCVDIHGNLASAVSSGGIALKQAGRIGPAAVCGCGCWARNWTTADHPGVAVAVSGSGEHIMRTQFAKECAQSVQCQDNASLGVSKAFRDKFLGSDFLWNVKERLAGVLVLRQDKEKTGGHEIVWSHSTSSMCVGYMAGNKNKAKALISRLPDSSVPGYSMTMEGKHFVL